jgi:hypothetical protein
MDDIAKEYTKQKDNKFKNFMSNISVAQVIIFGVILFIIIALNKNKTADPKYNYVLYGILIVIILILYFKPSKDKILIPEPIAKQIAQEALNKKVKEGKEFSFDSIVKVMPACQLTYESDFMTGSSGPVSWDIGYIEYVHGSQYKKEGVISIHPYEGIVTGLREYPLGYTGRETKDVRVVPVGIVQGNMKTTDYGNPPQG